MLNFPHCTICYPFVEYSKHSDLSSPKKKRNLKRKISKRKYRYLCSQRENQGCCRYKSQYKSLPKRYCRPTVGTVMQADPPGGRQLGEGQTEGGLPRRGAAYTLEQPGAAPTRCPLTAPCQHPMLRGSHTS